MARPLTTRTRFAPPEAEEATKLSDSSDKCNSVYDSGCMDSGFHSGANLSAEQFVSEEIHPEENESKSSVLLDSGLCLHEQLSGLNLGSGDLSESECEKELRKEDVISPESSVPRPSPSPVDVYFQRNEDGDTYLHCAVIQDFIEPAFALIRMAPEPSYLDIQNFDCQTPLHLAVLLDQPVLARHLVQAGASLAPRDRHGNTALHLASAAGNVKCLEALVEPLVEARLEPLLEALLEQRNYDGLMCVHLAAWNGHAGALEYLVRRGANINAREAKSGRTVLHLAVELRRASVLHLLLGEGLRLARLSLDATTYAGHTAYQLASCFDPAVASRLADCGAQKRPFPVDESSESEDEDEEVRT